MRSYWFAYLGGLFLLCHMVGQSLLLGLYVKHDWGDPKNEQGLDVALCSSSVLQILAHLFLLIEMIMEYQCAQTGSFRCCWHWLIGSVYAIHVLTVMLAYILYPSYHVNSPLMNVLYIWWTVYLALAACSVLYLIQCLICGHNKCISSSSSSSVTATNDAKMTNVKAPLSPPSAVQPDVVVIDVPPLASPRAALSFTFPKINSSNSNSNSLTNCIASPTLVSPTSS